MNTDNYRWHYDYVRLAWDAGFTFEKHKLPNIDKNKICLVDIERIINERDFASVECNVSLVVNYVLDKDQAKVLDTNFVKMFRLSQLSVEYLLFCKKYLDNTVVILKKEVSKLKQEILQLKNFSEELETQHDMLTTYKCNTCFKMFSTEDFLNAHIKRRHISLADASNTDTDKLQCEIKLLKERLNNTDKLLNEKDEEEKQKKVIYENNQKLMEVQEKFEKFKAQVQKELETVQIQKVFYEENYERLLGLLNSRADAKIKENVKKENVSVITKVETTTQTDKILQIESVHNKNVYEFKTPSIEEDNKEQTKVNNVNIVPDIDKKLNQFKEIVDTKVSSSLNNIEGKMEEFWLKLTELEKLKTMTTNTELHGSISKPVTEEVKPKIKPRSKFSQNNEVLINNNPERVAAVNTELNKFTEMKNVTDSDDSKDLSIFESESKSDEHVIPILVTKLPDSSVGKRSITNLKDIPENREVLAQKIRQEIDNIISTRLQDIGVSPTWKGIPQKSLERALAIVKHQGILSKKTYPNYDNIKRDIEKMLKQQTMDRNGKNHTKKVNSKKSPTNVIKVRYEHKPRISRTEPTRHIEPKVMIKNRLLYETDSESEHFPTKVKSPQKDPLPKYTDVINELKTIRKVAGPNINELEIDKEIVNAVDSTSDIENVGRNENHTEKQTLKVENEQINKGVLKNFPSVNSLCKKRVFFDLEDTDSDKNEINFAHAAPEGSTTSFGSSILDGHYDKKNNKNVIEEKDIDSLSDFDISNG